MHTWLVVFLFCFVLFCFVLLLFGKFLQVFAALKLFFVTHSAIHCVVSQALVIHILKVRPKTSLTKTSATNKTKQKPTNLFTFLQLEFQVLRRITPGVSFVSFGNADRNGVL